MSIWDNPFEPEVYYFVPTPAYNWVLTLGKWSAGIIFTIGALLWHFQAKLVYPANFPAGSRTDVWQPSKFGMSRFEEEMLEAPDGVKLHTYTILQGAEELQEDELAPKAPTVLMLHANAGNMGHRLPLARIFVRDLKMNVVMVSYRGYGKSEGSPTEKGIRQDAQTALDYLLSHRLLENTTVVLYGQSIGGAIAVDLASRNQDRISGLIVENTFMSIPRLVPHIMPYFTMFCPLLREVWNSEKAIATLKKDFPVLFLSGTNDEVVPAEEFQCLYFTCPSDKKSFIEFPEGTHNDTCLQKNYFEHIALFLRKHVIALDQGVQFQSKNDHLADDLEEMGAEAGSRLPQDIPKEAAENVKEEHSKEL